MTPSAILLPCPFPVFLCGSWHKIFFLLCGCPTSFTRTQALWGQNVCLFGFLPASTLQRTRPGTKQAHTQNTALMNEKKTIGTVCSTGHSQTNMTVFHHSIQTVPDAAAGSPPSLPSASANPTCQDPSATPPPPEGFLSPLRPQVSRPPLNCLPWYLLSLGH